MMFLAHLPPPVYGSHALTPQGKVAELRLELNSGAKKDKHYTTKKVALKKIVANMTMSNNDMVALFPDIIGCMSIQSLEIKKMYVLGQCGQQKTSRKDGAWLIRGSCSGASCSWSTTPGCAPRSQSRQYRSWNRLA
jgi:hypothetical protein